VCGRVEPDGVSELGDEFGLVENMNVSHRHGAGLYSAPAPRDGVCDRQRNTRPATGLASASPGAVFGGARSIAVVTTARSTVRGRSEHR
jgi:hypothetical protein